VTRAYSTGGFTLLEVMVSLLIFGLLSAAGVAVMAYTADNQGVVGERMDRLGEFQRARGVLRADLSQVALRRTRGADGRAARDVFIGGRADQSGPLLAFVRRGWSNPDRDPRASMQYVEYRLVDGQLERSTRGALDGASLEPPRVVLRGIRSARVGYRYRGEWIDGWPGGAEALPEAVELEFEMDGIGTVAQRFLVAGVAP